MRKSGKVRGIVDICSVPWFFVSFYFFIFHYVCCSFFSLSFRVNLLKRGGRGGVGGGKGKKKKKESADNSLHWTPPKYDWTWGGWSVIFCTGVRREKSNKGLL